MRVVKQKQKLGYFDDPLISDTNGKIYHSRDIHDMLLKTLEHIFTSHVTLFPTDIAKKINVHNMM